FAFSCAPQYLVSYRSDYFMPFSVYLFASSGAHPLDLHSFPTRRSSDLVAACLPMSRERGDGRRCSRGSRAARKSSQLGVRSASRDRKSTRLNSSHGSSSYAVFCLKKKTE